MKPDDHRKLTAHTLHYFKGYLTSQFTAALSVGDNEGELIQGTVNEDGFSIERATNWHFYRSGDDDQFLQPFEGFFNITYHPSSRNVVGDHNTKFNAYIQAHADGERIDSNDFFNLLGRVIHHIQDMNTPSHVVPVFHGPEFFRDFKWEKDHYEEFSRKRLPDYLKPADDQSPFQLEIESPGSLEQGFIDLYDRAAGRALDYLQSDASKFDATIGGKSAKASCELFWEPYDRQNDPNQGKQNRGFGQYGPLEKFFGNDIQEDIDGVTYKIAFSGYEHIYKHFIGSAIADTLTCLMYAGQRYSGQ